MPEWTRQTEVSSSTPAAIARTAWLSPLAAAVDDAITAYFATSPTGEDVTRAVLGAIGRERLERVAGSRTLNRAKQDLGLLVAQTLVSRFGAINVSTWRNGRTAVTRPNRDKTLPWVNSYTPHRVASA